MVDVGDSILITGQGKATVTELFQIENGGRWFIGFEKQDGSTGFFLEGDEEFTVITEVHNGKTINYR